VRFISGVLDDMLKIDPVIVSQQWRIYIRRVWLSMQSCRSLSVSPVLFRNSFFPWESAQ
jgi:hypothetical protein